MQAKRSGATQSQSIRQLFSGGIMMSRPVQTLHHLTNNRKKTVLQVTLKQHST
jgi:hypothetical protein